MLITEHFAKVSVMKMKYQCARFILETTDLIIMSRHKTYQITPITITTSKILRNVYFFINVFTSEKISIYKYK